ncbi:translation initiation factor eIF-2B alpha/beta/delta subunit family protein [Bounagaea algeriensis]
MTTTDTAPTLARSVQLDDTGVHLLDRRAFPFEHRWVHARSTDDVARAIEDMVTQSSGPYFAVLAGLVLAARETTDQPPQQARAHLGAAADRLIATRPTNEQPRLAAAWVLDTVDTALAEDPDADVPTAAARGAHAGEADYHDRSRALGRAAAALLPDTGRILTHCWADLYLIETVRAAQQAGKTLAFTCTETRPYLQGARLTAHTLAEMGSDVTVVTDAAPAALMRAGEIDALITASDRITLDGHVINKIGTLQLATAAHTFGVPFHALCHVPDPHAATGTDVPIEYRDGNDVLHTRGTRTATHRATGLYPAFDVTDPELVTTIVTDRGAYTPAQVGTYWQR